jgi:hypothetical protein
MSNFKKKLFTMLENEALKLLQKQLKEKSKPKEEPKFKDDKVF